ncbi:chaplin family protein [Streptomyces sp. NPDC051569]|uniref:chaplin n=1 Tax=Streptomyces sp. NPDC051569 TaxID=3365661 RepID=UPI00378A9AA2
MRQVTRKGLITVAAAGGMLALGGGYAQADSGAGAAAANSPGALSGNSVQVPVHIPVNVCGNTVNVVGVLNPALGNSCANTSHDAPGHGVQGSGGGYGDDGGDNGDGGYGDGGGYGGDAGGGGYGGGSQGGGSHGGGSQHGGSHTTHPGGSHAGGHTGHSPGVGSGNTIEVPIDVPVNVCGDSVTVIGLGNAVTGADCANDAPAVPSGGKPQQPVKPSRPGKPNHPGSPDEPGRPTTPTTRAIPPNPGLTPNAPHAPYLTQPRGADMLAQTGAGSLGTAIPTAAGMLLAGSVIYRRARAAS